MLEQIRDAIGAFQGIYLAVVSTAITLALLTMGNTLARLIGAIFLVLLLFNGTRWIRNRSESGR